MTDRERLLEFARQLLEQGERELPFASRRGAAVFREMLSGGMGAASTAQRGPDSQLPAYGAPPAVRRDMVAEGSTDWRAILSQDAGSAGEGSAGASRRSEPSRTPPSIAEPGTDVSHALLGTVGGGGAADPTLGGVPRGLVVQTVVSDIFSAGQYPSLEDVAAAVRACKGCALHRGALNAVPGEGAANADLVCVGEGPGATEDETGRPFVGRAGKLLSDILAAINLKREEVYICNVVKHRPPGNRTPLPDEVLACAPFLARQLELVSPRVILALGASAAQALLNTRLSLGKLRGSVHYYNGTPLVVTYHPAALLRNPGWKRPTWEDVQLVRRLLDASARA